MSSRSRSDRSSTGVDVRGEIAGAQDCACGEREPVSERGGAHQPSGLWRRSGSCPAGAARWVRDGRDSRVWRTGPLTAESGDRDDSEDQRGGGGGDDCRRARRPRVGAVAPPRRATSGCSASRVRHLGEGRPDEGGLEVRRALAPEVLGRGRRAGGRIGQRRSAPDPRAGRAIRGGDGRRCPPSERTPCLRLDRGCRFSRRLQIFFARPWATMSSEGAIITIELIPICLN